MKMQTQEERKTKKMNGTLASCDKKNGAKENQTKIVVKVVEVNYKKKERKDVMRRNPT